LDPSYTIFSNIDGYKMIFLPISLEIYFHQGFP
jgi:hypothetical protein